MTRRATLKFTAVLIIVVNTYLWNSTRLGLINQKEAWGLKLRCLSWNNSGRSRVRKWKLARDWYQEYPNAHRRAEKGHGLYCIYVGNEYQSWLPMTGIMRNYFWGEENHSTMSSIYKDITGRIFFFFLEINMAFLLRKSTRRAATRLWPSWRCWYQVESLVKAQQSSFQTPWATDISTEASYVD